ncbi:MAG TPA: hypothetical protein VJV79_05420 [Polyangiaceae bacterium]|nr:hypothetical protein [Polyangiaceae bacterium]
MFTLRCTGKLQKRLKVRPARSPPPSTTRLGDWFANLLYTKPQQLVLCVSAKTLLPVLVLASGAAPMEDRLREGLSEVLRAIGVPNAAIQAELLQMETVMIAATASRTVLGSMNDFVNMLSFDPPGLPLLARALSLAESPCSPIGMDSPKRATVELFAKPQLRVVK